MPLPDLTGLHAEPAGSPFFCVDLLEDLDVQIPLGQQHALLVHGGRTTQLWDAAVRFAGSGRVIALVRSSEEALS